MTTVILVALTLGFLALLVLVLAVYRGHNALAKRAENLETQQVIHERWLNILGDNR